MDTKIKKAKKRKISLSANENFWGYAFLLPAIIGFIIFTAIPVVMSFYYSLTNYDGIRPPEFVGLRNYMNLIFQKEFWNALWNTVCYTLGVVPFGTLLALIIAVMLNQKIKGIGVYRTAFFIPVIVSTVSVSMIWQWMYNQDYGLINALLEKLGLPQPGWLSTKELAMISVIIMSIWKGLGFNIVILLAGIQGISPSLYEAAEIDGAGAFRKFRNITVPLVRPTVTFVLILSLINAFQAFDQFYIMTKGGPAKATEVVVYLIYMNAFHFFKQGYASAIAYVLFIIIFILSIIQLRVSESKDM